MIQVQFKLEVRGAEDCTMYQDLSPRTAAILDLYMQGHPTVEIGRIVGLAESRVLFTLDRRAALSSEDSRVWAERLRLAHQAPAQATKAASRVAVNAKPVEPDDEQDNDDGGGGYVLQLSKGRLDELERDCTYASGRRRFGDRGMALYRASRLLRLFRRNEPVGGEELREVLSELTCEYLRELRGGLFAAGVPYLTTVQWARHTLFELAEDNGLL